MIAVLVLLPALMIGICQRWRLLDRIGVVLLSFGVGVMIAIVLALEPFGVSPQLHDIQMTIAELSIAVALPLLMFSVDVPHALATTGKALRAMLLAVLSVVCVSAAAVVLFQDSLANAWQVAGLSVGVYTGGGPNMAAIKSAIGADNHVFLTMVSYDMVFSSFYLVFMMIAGPRIAARFLPAYVDDTQKGVEVVTSMDHMVSDSAHSYRFLLSANTLASSFLALLLALVVVGASLLLANFLPVEYRSTGTILSLTSLGLILSFVPQVRRLSGSFHLGMYLILIFCVTTGSMATLDIFTSLNVPLALYFAFLMVGAVVLQALLCWCFGVDRDTFVITSAAAIMSLPFIPVIAGALKNRSIILPGMAASIMGYILGNYLGVMIANASRYYLSAS